MMCRPISICAPAVLISLLLCNLQHTNMSRSASRRSPSKKSFSTWALPLEEEAHLPDIEEQEEEECSFVEEEDKQHSTPTDLTQTIKQQLALDIQQRGGIDFFCLQTLCNDKQDIYGLPRSKQRKKIQNKVGRWKKLLRHEYNALISGAFSPSIQSPLQSPASPYAGSSGSSERVPTPDLASLRSPSIQSPSIRLPSIRSPSIRSPLIYTASMASNNFIENLLRSVTPGKFLYPFV